MRIPSWTWSAVIGLAANALAGCGGSAEVENGPPETALADGFADELTRSGGCADILVYATDEVGTLLLKLHTDALIDDARAAGGAKTYVFALPDPKVALDVEVGDGLLDESCTDVSLPGRIDETWVATSGQVTVEVQAESDNGASFENRARATVRFEGVELESGGASVSLGDLELSDISVGWLPG